ncbi:MAG: Phosphoserine phosphatase RsbU [Bacteroidetes bacterium ADurb.Bin217]|nr:MAG: Phosphoserine phosphatase RsbU [Bacteroidetes bacterium ADurb.Bin217]
MKRILFLIYIACISFNLSAQRSTLMFENVSMVDGLSQICVNDIMQDTTGFLWFATHDGLNMYDGYTFRVFKPSLQDNNSISSNKISCLFQDSKGSIWIGTVGGGLNLYNPLNESFTHFINDPNDSKSLSNDDVYDIFEDSKGNLWIATYGGGLNKFNRETQTFKAYKHDAKNPNSIGSNAVRAISQDNDGYLWIGLDVEGGLNKFDIEKEIFTRIAFNPFDIMSIQKDSKGMMWIGTYYGGFGVLNPKTYQYQTYTYDASKTMGLASNIVWTFFEDTLTNCMYIGTRGGGLNVFDIKTKDFVAIEKMKKDDFSIKSNNILSILRDKSGVIWIGTETAGLNKYNTQRKKFSNIYPSQLHDKPITSDNVFAMYEEENKGFWIGTRGAGLNFIDKTTFKTTTYQAKTGEILNFNSITSFVKDPRGFFWIGTDGNGIFRFNPSNNELEHFLYDATNKNSLSNDAITALYLDKNLQLWIGTYGGGLNTFNYEKKQFTSYPIHEFNFMRNVVWCIYQDSKGIIWAGTNGRGLMRVDPAKKSVEFFERNRHVSTSLNNNVVYSILETKNGDFWVGTGGAGVNKFNRKDKTFEPYTRQSHGLANDMILAMLEDNHGDIWMSTYFGLSKFEPTKGKFTNYNKLDGIQGNSFNERAAFKSSQGMMFFGGPNGVTYFMPDSIVNDTYTGKVVITDLKIYNSSVRIGEEFHGKVILDKSITYSSEIELSYKHNFSIEFAILNYIAPSKNKYKYRLIGFDEDWNFTDANKRFATYTNLSGKEYIFEVTATNNDGVWSDEVTRLKITVIPPFWRTTWFYSILILVVGILIYVYIKVREKQLIDEKKRLERMVEERTQEINQQKEELQLQSELLVRNNEELSRTNRLIKDSISYAKRIQDAMLPSIQVLEKHLPESFVLFKPRDIVSGDFYWFSEQNEIIYVAVSDCTGHGVPGAFMSMIGSTLLNEITSEKLHQKPSEILDKLNKGVVTALNQNLDGNPDSQDDGMDITICAINKQDKTIQIACANHIVFRVYNDTIESIQGDICSIGGLFSAEENKGYSNFEFKYKSGTRFYLFSDGYQDQFGGKSNKKFQASRFKELLFESRNVSMKEQFEILNTTFEEWKGTNRQIDDVLVMGIKLE